jgi:uncharacterized membrane protein
MDIKTFLASLVEEQIVDSATRDKIYAHFQALKSQQSIPSEIQKSKPSNTLLIVIGTIGVVLFGIGVIYIFAHNWDNLSRPIKTLLAFAPLFLSIAANCFTVFKRNGNRVWEESVGIGSFLATGSMLALLLQIYQLPGIESYFYFFWCALSLPIIYLMKSHVGVILALFLILFNLSSFPYDQSSLLRIPWFGSLMLFTGLIPYFKRLFTLQAPNHIYVLHQVLLPLVVLASVIVTAASEASAIWLILFLTLANFHLFGTSHLLRTKDKSPTIMSIISFVGLGLALSYLHYDENWHFNTLFDAHSFDYPLFIIPILLLLGIVQLIVFFRKEKPSVENAYKWLILVPLPFISCSAFIEFNAIPFQFFALLIICIFLVLSRKLQLSPTLYPAFSFLAMLIFSFIFFPNSNYILFYLSLIPGIFFIVPFFIKNQSMDSGKIGVQVVLVSIQLLYLLIGSFEGFWSSFMYTSSKSTFSISNTLPQTLLIFTTVGCILWMHLTVFKETKHFLAGIPLGLHLLTPALLYIGCFQLFPVYHVITLTLLIGSIALVIVGAKKVNLMITNLAMGLIGLVLLCRFFDMEMSLTLKGIIFILIGLGFFFANYKIMSSKKD